MPRDTADYILLLCPNCQRLHEFKHQLSHFKTHEYAAIHQCQTLVAAELVNELQNCTIQRVRDLMPIVAEIMDD